MWESFVQFLNTSIAPPLYAMEQPLDAWIDGLAWWVPRACAIGLFIVVGIGTLFFKREYIYLGAPDKAKWRDLRIWAILVLIPYIGVYLFFK